MIKNFVDQENIDLIVIGYPKNLDNTESDQSWLTKKFYLQLKKKLKCPIKFFDERLSTKEAKAEHNFFQKNSKEPLDTDSLSASLILRSFLRRSL